jgi:hypothetical protein
MMTKLDKLLKEIDPSRQIRKSNRSMNSALRTFSYGSLTIKNLDEFENYLAKFLCHTDNAYFKVKVSLHPKMHYQRCKQFLKEEFGPNGEKIAYQMAETGVNGGLLAVLKIIARGLTQFYARNAIRSVVDEYWDKLTFNERESAAKEYHKKYGDLIPPTYPLGSPNWLVVSLNKILVEHPFILERIRQVVRERKIHEKIM